MDIHSLLSNNLKNVDSQSIKAFAALQTDIAARDLLFNLCEKVMEVEHLIDSGSLSKIPGAGSTKPAVFVARRLDGSMHVGWHHADVEAFAGDCFHYDHGAGIEQNQDGQYVWFPLITVFVNFTFNQETNSFDGDWDPCELDTNVKSELSVYQLALTKGLESKIQDKPKIGYVTLCNPLEKGKKIEVRRFTLGY